MNVESARAFLLSLPHVVETMQWGDNLVFWVGDKAIGGKMFTLIALDADPHSGQRADQPIISFSAGAANFAALLEVEGCRPAPYLARIHWIAATRWSVFSAPEWQDHLRHAYALTLARLTPRTRAILALPVAKQRREIAARRRQLAAAKALRQPGR